MVVYFIDKNRYIPYIKLLELRLSLDSICKDFSKLKKHPILNRILLNDISDHFMIFKGFNTDFKIHDQIVNDKSYKKTRKFTTTNINKLKSLIYTLDWSYVYSDININIIVDTFILDLYMLFNVCCPKVSI